MTFLANSWDFLKSIFSRVEAVEAYEFKVYIRKSEDLGKSWRARLDELMERVGCSRQKGLIIVDELPDMLHAMRCHSDAECNGFLHWFRKTREKSLKGNVRWLVGGSVNVEMLRIACQAGKRAGFPGVDEVEKLLAKYEAKP